MQQIKTESGVSRRLLIITSLLVLIGPDHLTAFWLTDGSLFQQPAGIMVEDRLVSGSQSVQPNLTPAAATSNQAVDDRHNSTTSNSAKNQPNETTATSNIFDANSNSWTRVQLSESTPPVTSRASDPLPESVSRQEQRDNFVTGSGAGAAACQCQPEWVQNQTSLWVGRWLNSSNFAHQIRTQVLMLAAAKAPQAKQNQQQARQVPLGTNLRPGLGWTRHQAVGKRGGSGDTAGHGHGGGARGIGRLGRHHQTATNNAAPSVNSNGNGSHVESRPQAIQGERGPKGDQGPKGERGPSGLISVKDRGALFDLDLAKDQDGRQGGIGRGVDPRSGANRPRLVFVELEQMLVLETSSGWRPVPLMAPLHDFRKAIAKFSLSAATEVDKKKLIQSQDGSNLSSVPSPITPFRSNLRVPSRESPLTSNSIIGVIDEARGKLTRDGLNISDEFESDDDDDNDEDEDGGPDDDEDEDEDEDDETLEGSDPEEENDDEDEDDNTIGYDGRRGVQAGNNQQSKMLRANQIAAEAGGYKTKRRRAQVGDRSATPAEMASLPQTDRSGQSLGASPAKSYNELMGSSGSRPTPLKLRLIALNEPVSGKQRGLRGANFECKRNAAQAGIKGAFQALLATNYQNLNEIVRHNSHVQKHPIVNMRGEILAASWQDLFRAPARAAHPLSRIYSFDGRHVASNPNWPNKLIWLGTSSKMGARDSSGYNCDGWHSDSLSRFGFAAPLHTPRGQHAGGNNHHNHLTQNGPGRKIRSHRRRFAAETDAIDGHKVEDGMQMRGQNGTTQAIGPNLVFDFLDKYPCRMPLIVLCIETIAQEE